MQFIKQNVVGIILGLCIAITVFHVWFLYSISAQTGQNTAAIQQVVSFLNEVNKNTAGVTPQ